MKRIQKKVFIITLFFFTILGVCVSYWVNKKRTSYFFQNYVDSIKGSPFKLFPNLNADSCSFNMKFLSYYERSEQIFEGILFEQNNCIYLRITEPKCISTYKFYDFNLSINDSISIEWTTKTASIKNYVLFLEDKFYEQQYSDTIYKFRCKGFGVALKDDDVVFFVGKKVGIIGLYIGKYIKNGTEIIFKVCGRPYLNLNKNRIIYKQLL